MPTPRRFESSLPTPAERLLAPAAWQHPSAHALNQKEQELLWAWMRAQGQNAQLAVCQIGHFPRLWPQLPPQIKYFLLLDTSSNSAPHNAPMLVHKTISSLDHIPALSQQFDITILPHSLDRRHNPEQLLREALRVTRPHGQVWVLGLKPDSLWYLQTWFCAPAKRHPLQEATRTSLSALSIVQMMKRHGARRLAQHSYGPLLWRQSDPQFPLGLARTSERWWPHWRCAYALSFQKNLPNLKKPRPAPLWRARMVYETCV